MIGNLIFTLRTQQEIPQKKLCYGLCSDATLSRIELDERTPDKFLLDALVQRLGKSPDKFFSVLSERDYVLLCLREEIEKAMEENKWQKVEATLNIYLESKEAKSGLHKQYCEKIQSFLKYQYTKDPAASERVILSAIRCTIPGFDPLHLKDYYLCREEVILILILLACMKAQEKTSEYQGILWDLINYIDDHYTDEEEKVKIYPKAAVFQAELFMEQGKYQEAIDITEKAIELSAGNAVIFGLSRLLQINIECQQKSRTKAQNEAQIEHQEEVQNEEQIENRIEHQAEEHKEARDRKKQLESLKWVYDTFEVLSEKDSDMISKCNSQTELFLMNEIIRSSRKNNGMSQEVLGGDILAPETISRIESGKRKPHLSNFKKIKKALGIDKDIYNVEIITDNFAVYEKKREIDRLAAYHKYDEVNQRFEELKKLIDMDDKLNVQYILMTQTWLDYRENKLSQEKTVKKLNDILDLTLKRQSGSKIETLNLSKQEVTIINRIAIIYDRLKQSDKAIQLLQDVLKSFHNSQIDMKYHSVSALLVMSNLEKFLEESNLLEEAIDICDQAIRLSLQCGRGQFLGKYLAKKGFVLERMMKESSGADEIMSCADYFHKAYHISVLMKDTISANIIAGHANDKYPQIHLFA